MKAARALAFVLALGALAAIGAAVALLMLSTIGGAPERDPVGRLSPVLPGLAVTTVTVVDPAVPPLPAPTEGDGDGDDD